MGFSKEIKKIVPPCWGYQIFENLWFSGFPSRFYSTMDLPLTGEAIEYFSGKTIFFNNNSLTNNYGNKTLRIKIRFNSYLMRIRQE